jgi:predicted MFS family arabinose efflux permease
VAERSQAGVRDVVIVAGIAVAAVLGGVVLTSILPDGVQRFLFHEPVTIAVLIVGTAFVLWRVATRRPPEP